MISVLILLALLSGASLVAGFYIARLQREVAELNHLLNHDWRCDACGKWFSRSVPKKVHGYCDLCKQCAREAKEQADA